MTLRGLELKDRRFTYRIHHYIIFILFCIKVGVVVDVDGK